MSDKVKEFIEMPQEFAKEGKLVSFQRSRASVQASDLKNSSSPGVRSLPKKVRNERDRSATPCYSIAREMNLTCGVTTEYVQICKAVAIGFGIMGFIGYFVKLIHIPM